MDDGEYLFPLCSSAPHYERHFIGPIHVTVSIIYQILARLWVWVMVKRRSICTVLWTKIKEKNKCISARKRGNNYRQLRFGWYSVYSRTSVRFCPVSKFKRGRWRYSVRLFFFLFFWYRRVFLYSRELLAHSADQSGQLGWGQVKGSIQARCKMIIQAVKKQTNNRPLPRPSLIFTVKETEDEKKKRTTESPSSLVYFTNTTWRSILTLSCNSRLY